MAIIDTNPKPANIIEAFKILKGNTLISVLFEPMWGIPYVLYHFYLSLYMKSQGVTDKQMGYIISLGFIAAIVFSVMAGTITDALGRKRATLIFDLIGWPCAILIYAFSNNFWMFALATVVNSAHRVTAVAFNLMVVEDADSQQRIAAFNLINIINISAGLLTPLAGIAVRTYGIVRAERFLLVFAALSMGAMMILRNHFYTETQIGQRILDEHPPRDLKQVLANVFGGGVLRELKQKPEALKVIAVAALFNMHTTVGTHFSLYFAPYLTEVMGIERSMVSVFGVVNSATMLLVFIFINPIINGGNMIYNLLTGLILQMSALFLLITISGNHLIMVGLCIALLAAGFGVFKPFMDTMLAEVTGGKRRAGMYSVLNAVTCTFNAGMGFLSGYIYDLNPRLLYTLSMITLLICAVILMELKKNHSDTVEETFQC
jgi:MFS family permease